MLEKEKVEAALDEVRKVLQADGGDVHLVKIEGDDVYVRLVGACAGCPARQITLKQGVEKFLKEKLPGIGKVIPA